MIQDEGSPEKEYSTEEMRDMFAGICIKEFVVFFGERLQYYITEESEKAFRSRNISCPLLFLYIYME